MVVRIQKSRKRRLKDTAQDTAQNTAQSTTQTPHKKNSENCAFPTIKGSSRTPHRHRTKSTALPTDPPPSISITPKQKEVLQLIEKGMYLTEISRSLYLNKSSARDRVNALEKKGLIKKDLGRLRLTKTGKMLVNSCAVGSVVCAQKNIHASQFTVHIDRMPQHWNQGHIYFECLRAQSFFKNEQSNQWFAEFEDCKIRISPTTRKVTFFIKNQAGQSFDEIQSQIWDSFVRYFRLLTDKGFKLDYHVESPNPHFANPDGFFAKLASMATPKGFRLDCLDLSFWVDYSQGPAEEETDSEEGAQRMEQVARSVFASVHDFTDLDKVIDIVGQLVKLRLLDAMPKPEVPDYVG